MRRLIGSHEAQTEFATTYVQAKAGDRILDLGCGLAGIHPILPKGVTYVGLDLNPRYVDFAAQRFGDAPDAHTRFVCANAALRQPELASQFDLVLARGLLHHLSDADATDTITNAAHYLAPGGRLITLDPVYHPRQNLIARGLLGLDRGLYIRTQDRYRALLSVAFGTVEATLRTDLLRIPYSHIIHVCQPPLTASGAAA